MFSSKVSGDDQGYSFNSAQEMEFVFYNNTLELNRKLISPIASMAMSYYKYKLIGASLDENGQLVNKILVEPKNDFGPCFRGYIYINEDLWNINSVELYATKEAIQLPFIDSLSFKQIYIPVEKDRWMMLSNVIQFEMKPLGLKLEVTSHVFIPIMNWIMSTLTFLTEKFMWLKVKPTQEPKPTGTQSDPYH